MHQIFKNVNPSYPLMTTQTCEYEKRCWFLGKICLCNDGMILDNHYENQGDEKSDEFTCSLTLNNLPMSVMFFTNF